VALFCLSIEPDMIVFFRAYATCLLLLAGITAAHAGDVKAGRQIALTCQGCHGMDGLSKQPDAPNLAMQPEAYLIKAMAEYANGIRRNEQMKVAAAALSEKQVADVAAYYAAIEIEVIKKP
jgi:cytochrome c553